MTLLEKAKRANEVYRDREGYISCNVKNHNGIDSLVYEFQNKMFAHNFLLEQQMNFEGNKEISISINPNNDTQVIKTYKTEINERIENEKKVEITQEIIDKYSATNEEFWDAFYNGSQNTSYSLFKDLKIDSKEDLIDSINADKSMINILNKLFKHTLLKGEFFVANAEESLILTNYRLLVLGSVDLSIPLSKITKYGAEGNFFVVKYLKNREDKSVTLNQYIDETLVNSVIEEKEFANLNSEQISILEFTNSVKLNINKPNYDIPSISKKMKNKINTYKLWGTIFLLPQLIGLWTMSWYFSGTTEASHFFSKALASIIIVGLCIRWGIFIFKTKSIIGVLFKIFSLSIPILTIIWLLHLLGWVSGYSDLRNNFSLESGFYLTLVSSIIFVILTFKLNK